MSRAVGTLVRLVAVAGAVAAASCDSATDVESMTVTIDTPTEGATRYATQVTLAGTIVGAESPVVTYSVSGQPFAAAELVDGQPGKFRATLSGLGSGAVSVTVKVVDGGRVAMITRAFNHTVVTMTLQAPAPTDSTFGRVVSYRGTLSRVASLSSTVGGGAQLGAVVNVPHPTTGISTFYGEAHPLANGINWIKVTASIDSELVAADSFEVRVAVPDRHYTAVVVEAPGALETQGVFLGNDGRVAGHWWTNPDSLRSFTWFNGVFVMLDSMRRVQWLNNVGQVLGLRAPASQETLIWANGAYQAVSGFTGGVAINDQGRVARGSTAGYWENGTIVSYSTPPGLPFVIITSINNSSQIAGTASASTHFQPVAWSSASSFFTVAVPSGTSASTVRRIGDGGHMLLTAPLSAGFGLPPDLTGTRTAFSYNGSAVDLNAVVGHGAAVAAVNASGTVAGTYQWSSQLRTFTWVNGRTTDVVLDTPGWTVTTVWSINDLGQLSVGATNAAGKKATLILTPN